MIDFLEGFCLAMFTIPFIALPMLLKAAFRRSLSVD